jgi:hypothetical protein
MSLVLAGAVVGVSITLLALVLIAVTIGIHRQEHAASIGHRPVSRSAALARRILGLHTSGACGPDVHPTEDTCLAKETTPDDERPHHRPAARPRVVTRLAAHPVAHAHRAAAE